MSRSVLLDGMFDAIPKRTRGRRPFSFVFDGRRSEEFLDEWPCAVEETALGEFRHQVVARWTDPKSGLCAYCEAIRYRDFPAVEWLLRFENTGSADTPIIENVRNLDLSLEDPLTDHPDYPYWLHRTNGAPANETDFAVRRTYVNPWTDHQPGNRRYIALGGDGGRSSNKDLPFFKVETGTGSLLVAIGWSGQWQCQVRCPFAVDDDPAKVLWPAHKVLSIVAGLEDCHFRLHPGESVRGARILLMFCEGDTLESNARFRRLIYKHYTPTREGRKPLPTPFCNTFFTRCTDDWLNECTAENQLPLVRAYAKLGVDAVITDAGWFEEGWGGGVGNYRVDAQKYPQGMAPLAAAAKEGGIVYGLWFEPERAMAGTQIHREHPEWLLPAGPEPQPYYHVNFGLPEVQDFFFGVVKRFMDLPGFRFYRQDFNHFPLAHWRYGEPPDRRGITEMKHIVGLYGFWDRIAAAWPDSFRQECASGGRRIDLETVARMHLHQDSDCHLIDEIDQAQCWGLSQYLPNNVITSPLTLMDDYSFHTALPHSISLGWVADTPDFDWTRATQLLDRYRAVRHLLVGAWYPLLPSSIEPAHWMASQFHRPDLDEGMVLAFRRTASPFPTADFSLHDLDAEATYTVSEQQGREQTRATGRELMCRFCVTLPERRQSKLFIYRKSADR